MAATFRKMQDGGKDAWVNLDPEKLKGACVDPDDDNRIQLCHFNDKSDYFVDNTDENWAIIEAVCSRCIL